MNLNGFWSAVDKHIKDRVVLVADSNPYLRSIIRTILLQIGVKATREVGDGFEAIDAICAFDPWVMILDWSIKGMDAREVVRVIRTSGIVPDPKMPIIGMTDPIKKTKVMEAKVAGIDHLLLRPLSPKILQTHLFPTMLKMVQSPELIAASAEAEGEDLLTPEKVAEILHVSPSWLSNARKKGYGPTYLHVGRKVRYRRTAVINWIKSREERLARREKSSTRKGPPEGTKRSSAGSARKSGAGDNKDGSK